MEISKEDYAAVLSSFLDEMNFKMPSKDMSFELQEETVEYFRNQPWDDEIRQEAIQTSEAMCRITLLFPYASHVTKYRISVINAYLTIIDDINFADALYDFGSNLLRGKPQENPVLKSFLEFLSNDKIKSTPYMDSVFLQDVIQYMIGNGFERDEIVVPAKGAKRFPGYVRDMTGIGELYALIMFCDLVPEREYKKIYVPALQDLTFYLIHVNDILSFYKENLYGDGTLFIRDYGIAKGLSTIDALRLTCSKSVENIKNIRLMFSGHNELLKRLDGLINGYVEFHIRMGRYRLNELPSLEKYFE